MAWLANGMPLWAYTHRVAGVSYTGMQNGK